jgi:hypothetical protein
MKNEQRTVSLFEWSLIIPKLILVFFYSIGLP